MQCKIRPISVRKKIYVCALPAQHEINKREMLPFVTHILIDIQYSFHLDEIKGLLTWNKMCVIDCSQMKVLELRNSS